MMTIDKQAVILILALIILTAVAFTIGQYIIYTQRVKANLLLIDMIDKTLKENLKQQKRKLENIEPKDEPEEAWTMGDKRVPV